MKAWLCLGSNQDKPFEQLEKALMYLNEKCYITVLRSSAAITSQPYGFINQPDFANQIVEIDTRLSLDELLKFVKAAEIELGRKPTFKWGPRIIDMDIIFYEDMIVHTPDLNVPHPGIPKRDYLIKLLNDMIPDFVHPELKKTINDIYNDFINQGV